MNPRGALALVLASLLWGTTGTAAAFLPANVSPLATGAVTMTIGGILLFAVSARGSLGVLRERVPRNWALLGAVGVFVYPLAFYSSMHLAGVAVGNVVTLGSGPVFAALLEWAIERRRPSARWMACTSVAAGGIVLLGAFGTSGAFGTTDVFGHPAAAASSSAWGVALGLLAGFAYALYAYCSSRAIATGHASGSVIGAMFGVGALVLLPVLLVTGAPLLQSSSSIGIAAYLAIGPMFLAYLAFGYGLRDIRTSTATTITLIEPVVATVLAVVVLHEQLGALGWVGMGLIMIGIVGLSSARRSAGTT